MCYNGQKCIDVIRLCDEGVDLHQEIIDDLNWNLNKNDKIFLNLMRKLDIQ